MWFLPPLLPPFSTLTDFVKSHSQTSKLTQHSVRPTLMPPPPSKVPNTTATVRFSPSCHREMFLIFQPSHLAMTAPKGVSVVVVANPWCAHLYALVHTVPKKLVVCDLRCYNETNEIATIVKKKLKLKKREKALKKLSETPVIKNYPENILHLHLSQLISFHFKMYLFRYCYCICTAKARSKQSFKNCSSLYYTTRELEIILKLFL